ncbi:MAG: hypothetical protein ABSB90_09505 [Thermoplasmata archaeon]
MPAPARPPPPRGRTERLAYVFFHRPLAGVSRAAYERALRRFHATLARTPPAGFRESSVLRLDTAPWAEPRPRPVYVDWYVLGGFGILDSIRDVAYCPPWVGAHRSIARKAAYGWGALYAAPRPAGPPAGEDRLVWSSDEHLLTLVGPGAPPGRPRVGTLWRRQLALGPSPEFCWVLPSGERPPHSRGSLRADSQGIFPRETRR